jgi:lipid II:glycine glycyltransferase (peptidoglycan interpeptide bridge formation enzyme)
MRDPYQTEEWAKIKEGFGYEVLKAGNTYLYTRRTPLGSFVDVQYPVDPADIVGNEIMKMKPISLSIFNDLQYSGSSFEGFGHERSRVSCKVDLTLSAQELWDGLKKQNRSAIRQAERKGCEFRIGKTDEDFEAFYDHYSSLAGLKHFRLLKKDVMKRTFKSPIASIYMSCVNGEPAALAFVLHSDMIARFWYGAGAPRFYVFRPSNFLHWKIILEAKSRGCLYYDLDGDSPFKASFGGKPYYQQIAVRKSLRSRLAETLVSIKRSVA